MLLKDLHLCYTASSSWAWVSMWSFPCTQRSSVIATGIQEMSVECLHEESSFRPKGLNFESKEDI